jgi:hypothetical protein
MRYASKEILQRMSFLTSQINYHNQKVTNNTAVSSTFMQLKVLHKELASCYENIEIASQRMVAELPPEESVSELATLDYSTFKPRSVNIEDVSVRALWTIWGETDEDEIKILVLSNITDISILEDNRYVFDRLELELYYCYSIKDGLLKLPVTKEGLENALGPIVDNAEDNARHQHNNWINSCNLSGSVIREIKISRNNLLSCFRENTVVASDKKASKEKNSNVNAMTFTVSLEKQNMKAKNAVETQKTKLKSPTSVEVTANDEMFPMDVETPFNNGIYS